MKKELVLEPYLVYDKHDSLFLSGGTKIEAVRGEQQEKRPLNTSQGSRAAQRGWGNNKQTQQQQTHNQTQARRGAPPSFRCELGREGTSQNNQESPTKYHKPETLSCTHTHTLLRG